MKLFTVSVINVGTKQAKDFLLWFFTSNTLLNSKKT